MAHEKQSQRKADETTAKNTLADVLACPPFTRTCEIVLGAASSLPRLPPLSLDCRMCDQSMIHDGRWAHVLVSKHTSSSDDDRSISLRHQVALYTCRHCRQQTVTFPLKLRKMENSSARFTVQKIGQHPKYAPRIPTRIQRFLQNDDWKLYRKGWDAETAELGIGAYAYYRRVVEHVWIKLLGKLIEVAENVGDIESEKQLKAAQGQWKFLQAVDDVQPAVPPRVLIGTNNPLKLLHDAFSDGVHNLDDEECLHRARDGRRVLEELLNRIDEVLKDDKALLASIGRLQAHRTKSKTKSA